MKKSKAPMFLQNVPTDLKEAFQIWCLKHHISMSKAVVELMRKALGKDKTK